MRIHVAKRDLGDPLVALSDFAFGRKHRNGRKIPEPTMFPITSAVAIHSPIERLSFG